MSFSITKKSSNDRRCQHVNEMADMFAQAWNVELKQTIILNSTLNKHVRVPKIMSNPVYILVEH